MSLCPDCPRLLLNPKYRRIHVRDECCVRAEHSPNNMMEANPGMPEHAPLNRHERRRDAKIRREK